MNPDDDNDDSSEEPNETDPAIRVLHLEMVRLQAQIDQLTASAWERAREIEEMNLRLAELIARVNDLKNRQRMHARLWIWIAALFGAVAGLGLSYLVRL